MKRKRYRDKIGEMYGPSRHPKRYDWPYHVYWQDSPGPTTRDSFRYYELFFERFSRTYSAEYHWRKSRKSNFKERPATPAELERLISLLPKSDVARFMRAAIRAGEERWVPMGVAGTITFESPDCKSMTIPTAQGVQK